MSYQEFLLLFSAIIASGLGQLFLKAGALKLDKVTAGNALEQTLRMIMVPELLGGLLCYGIGAVLYILVLTRVKLSIAAPAASLIYVFSVVVGHVVFHESLSSQRLFGIGFIILGVILIAWKQS